MRVGIECLKGQVCYYFLLLYYIEVKTYKEYLQLSELCYREFWSHVWAAGMVP